MCLSLHFHGTYTSLFNVVVSKQVVYYKGHQVHNLNELEYINGEVWANVYMVCLCTINYDCSWRKYISFPKFGKPRQMLAMYMHDAHGLRLSVNLVLFLVDFSLCRLTVL